MLVIASAGPVLERHQQHHRAAVDAHDGPDANLCTSGSLSNSPIRHEQQSVGLVAQLCERGC